MHFLSKIKISNIRPTGFNSLYHLIISNKLPGKSSAACPSRRIFLYRFWIFNQIYDCLAWIAKTVKGDCLNQSALLSPMFWISLHFLFNFVSIPETYQCSNILKTKCHLALLSWWLLSSLVWSSQAILLDPRFSSWGDSQHPRFWSIHGPHHTCFLFFFLKGFCLKRNKYVHRVNFGPLLIMLILFSVLASS